MEPEIKLAFSGGGFRATLYALGAYRRLVELGLDRYVTMISSVSGGSIIAAKILVALKKGPFLNVADFDKRVTEPIRELVELDLRKTLIKNVFKKHLFSLELPRKRFSKVFPIVLNEKVYEGLYMKELPQKPEWICNTTCLNTGRKFCFTSRKQMYGTFLGNSNKVDDITVAYAVATSAAFPILFSPYELPTYDKKFNLDTFDNPILYLCDGGVFDNLGSEALSSSLEINRALNHEVYKGERIEFLTPLQMERDGVKKSVFFVLDASAKEKGWDSSQSGYFKLNRRILNVSSHQTVLLRRKLISSSNIEGIQLILTKPLEEMLEDISNNKYINSKAINVKSLPNYQTNYKELEDSLSTLRTDLNKFNKIEIDMLLWAGATRMDIAARLFFQDIITNQEIPPFPSYSEEEMRTALSKGKHRPL